MPCTTRVVPSQPARPARPIGANDMHIAAHARSEGLALVTHNMGEFARVPGLEAENWVHTAQ